MSDTHVHGQGECEPDCWDAEGLLIDSKPPTHAENCAPEYNEHGVPVCRCEADEDPTYTRNVLGPVVVRDMLQLADDLARMGLGDSANALRWLAGAVAKETGTEIER